MDWKNTDYHKVKVAWKDLVKPKTEGGLGIKKANKMEQGNYPKTSLAHLY